MSGHRMPASTCPGCGYVMDGATEIGANPGDGAKPEPGDLTVCIRCAAVLVFSQELILRAITEQEVVALPTEVYQRVQGIQAAVHRLHRSEAH